MSDETLLSQYQLDSKLKKRRYFEKISNQIDSIKPNTAKATIKQMYADAVQDDEVLEQLITELKDAYSLVDEKFTKVEENIVKELAQGRKVILISQFADTAKYYYENLLSSNNILSDNLGLITGNDEDNRIGEYPETKKEILDRFSPLSKNRKDIFGTVKEINLLVGTDTISTGQNLQDAVVLMNLDLPYNPMVLEQRIGRIDRPRQDSSVNNIFVYTFPVYEAIDVELQMSERLGKKMAGVMSDTEFDDIVLPEYTSYLEDVKRDKGKAVQTMLDRTVEKTIYNQGTVSEKHSTDYKEANKRLYDTKNSAIKRTEKPVYPKYSFSKNNSSHTIVVARINYKDVNGAVISNEERIFDTSELSNSDITNAESHLRQSKIGGISSTAELSKEKSEILLGNELEKLEKYKQKLVDNFNQSVDTAKSNLQSLQNKTAEKAALEIGNSVKDLKNRSLIMSKLQEAGLVPKDVSKIANVIRMVDEESELFQYVKEIAANVDRFWLDFTDYAELFDFSRLENSVGAKVKRASNRKANIEKTEIEVIIGNIVFS